MLNFKNERIREKNHDSRIPKKYNIQTLRKLLQAGQTRYENPVRQRGPTGRITPNYHDRVSRLSTPILDTVHRFYVSDT